MEMGVICLFFFDNDSTVMCFFLFLKWDSGVCFHLIVSADLYLFLIMSVSLIMSL